MEAFDRHIKSKIESLTEVPGVAYNEKRVWKRIWLSRNGGVAFFTVAIILLTSIAAIILLPHEGQRENEAACLAKEGKPGIVADTTSVVYPEKEIRPGKFDTGETNPFTKPGNSLVKNINGDGNMLPSLAKKAGNDLGQPAGGNKPFATRQQVKKPFPDRVGDTTNTVQKALSITPGKGSLAFGVARLKRIDNRFSLRYGIQFNRHWGEKFVEGEGINRRFEIHQIQLPVGLRYNFRRAEGRFNPFFYNGLNSSFLFGADAKAMDYSMGFESALGLDYRIFSTEDGKKGYLRFKLPLYNKNIINQGLYQPSLYDALNKNKQY